MVSPGLIVWAARDLLRRPAGALISGIALICLACLLATSTLLTQAATNTGRRLVEAGPSIVVRQVGAAGWAPLPEDEAAALVSGVTGVTLVRARIWGAVEGVAGAVTVIGVDDAGVKSTLVPRSLPAPERGQAVLGPGVEAGQSLELGGLTLHIVGVLDEATSMAAHDVVILHREDARALLGIPAGHASDLAVYVFHDDEAPAVAADIEKALPWPCRVTTREQASGSWQASTMRRGGLTALAALPAALALVLLVLGAAHNRSARREIGLLRAVGWTTRDVVALHSTRALLVGLPAVCLALAASWFLVHSPGVTWPASLFLGWEAMPPELRLDHGGSLVVLIEVAAMVLVPWLAASLWPVLRASTADPHDLVEEGRS